MTRITDGIKESLHYSFRRNPLKVPAQAFREIKYLCQRAVRGWADNDTWAIDTTMVGYLGSAMSHMGRDTHGAPPGYPSDDWNAETDFDQWKSDLTEHGTNLVEYANCKFDFDEDLSQDEYVELMESSRINAQDSLRWVADWLPHLWD